MGRAAAGGARDELQRERAAFLTGRDVSALVPAEVVESWRRSDRLGVVPDRLELTYTPDVDQQSELCRAALPVIERLAERLDTSHTALVLADEHAVIVGRWVGDLAVLAELDGADALPGVHLDECHAGNNGLGTTIELDRPVVVSGPEHYADRYQAFTCAGVPIHHPLDDRPLGVLDLVCRYGDANGLMLPVLAATVEEIRRRLLELVSGFERMLLDRFMTERAHHPGPLVVLGGGVLLANPPATRLLRAADHELLRQLAAEAAGGPVDADVTLAEGREVRLHGEPLTDVPGRIGYVVDVAPVPRAAGATPLLVGDRWPRNPARSGARRPGPPPPPAWPTGRRRDEARPPAADLEDTAGYSRTWQRTLAEARRHARFALPVLVHGEVGTGKVTLLQAMWQAGGLAGPLRSADAALVALDGPGAFLGRLRDWLGEPDGLVVLRHADVLDDATAAAVAAVLDEGAGGEVRVAATATAGVGVAAPLRDRLDVASIRLPSLRERPGDLALVVARLRQRDPALRPLSAEALEALARADWPGNVRQLRNVLLRASSARPHGLIEVVDLPLGLAPVARRPLTHLEQLEMTAIVTHLRDAGGNKLEAAARLGISRSTLYRKIHAYGIDA